jgi:hypothetical protein
VVGTRRGGRGSSVVFRYIVFFKVVLAVVDGVPNPEAHLALGPRVAGAAWVPRIGVGEAAPGEVTTTTSVAMTTIRRRAVPTNIAMTTRGSHGRRGAT